MNYNEFRNEVLACLTAYIHELEKMLKTAEGEMFKALRLELLIAVHVRRQLRRKHD